MRRRFHFSPALVIALLALFFAFGGSAFALGSKIVPQPRCAQGAVRGIVEVTGQVDKGVANLPDQYTSTTSYFGRHWSCSGGAIQAKRLSTGVYYVKFVGNAATSAIVSAIGPDALPTTVVRSPDGSFEVNVGSNANPEDEAFTVVIV